MPLDSPSLRHRQAMRYSPSPAIPSRRDLSRLMLKTAFSLFDARDRHRRRRRKRLVCACRRRRASAPSPSAAGPPFPTSARPMPTPIRRRASPAKACCARPRRRPVIRRAARRSGGKPLVANAATGSRVRCPRRAFWTLYAADRRHAVLPSERRRSGASFLELLRLPTIRSPISVGAAADARQLAGVSRHRPDDPRAHALRHADRQQHRRRRYRAAADRSRSAAMLRLLYALLVGLVGAGIVHIAVLLLSAAFSRSRRLVAPGRCGRLLPVVTHPTAQDGTQPVVEPPIRCSTPPPAGSIWTMAPSVCAPGKVPFWSVSVYDRGGQNIYTFNDRTADGRGSRFRRADAGADDRDAQGAARRVQASIFVEAPIERRHRRRPQLRARRQLEPDRLELLGSSPARHSNAVERCGNSTIRDRVADRWTRELPRGFPGDHARSRVRRPRA